MLTSHQHSQLVRFRWSAFIIVGLAYVLSFFHRFAPAASRRICNKRLMPALLRWADWRPPIFMYTQRCRFPPA